MALITTHALCLRKIDFSESSQILTLLTDKLGTAGTIAKGAKREKSSTGGPLDLMCLYQVVLYDRTKRGTLSILAQAELVDFFPELRSHYASFEAAENLREILLAMDVPPQDGPSLLLLAVKCLRDLGRGRDAEVLARCAWSMLRALGIEPEVTRCVASGREPTGKVEVTFSALEMGLLAPPYNENRGDLLRVSPPTLAALRALATGLDAPGLSVDAFRGAFRLLAWLLARHAGRRLATVPVPDPALPL